MNQLETPVAMIIFNQPEATRRVFARVAAARPSRLLIIADCARPDRPEEANRCEETKKIVAAVDWPCQVETNFLSENVGPRRRIISGISWVFSLVEEAIFLEHDCLPDPSFFPYCSELLARYRNQPQIGYIAGFNPLEKSFPFPYSYYYSRVASLWGWATWRRTWQEYDEHLSAWQEIRKWGLLNLLFPDKKVVKYWTRVFDSMHDGTGPNTWDYQLAYTCWTRNFLNIVPRRNLIQYIGFGPQAENTSQAEPGLTLEGGPLMFPLQHPPAITPWPSYEMEFQKRFYAQDIFRKLYRRLIMQFQSTTH
jgi:hypothetical protein